MTSRRRLLAATVLASHVVLLVMIAFGAPCLERCPGEGPSGRCAPMCVACPCAPRLAPPAHVAAPLARPAPRARVPALAMLAPHEPEPADIFHVPKHVLA